MRELLHVLERAVITSTGGRLNIELPSTTSVTRVPEAFLADLTPDLVKLRVLWSTREARQQHMLVSYDQVLTAITNVVGRLQSQSQRAA